MSMRAKGQVASMDLVIAAIVLLLFIGLLIVAIPLLNPKKSEKTIYGGEVFGNIEHGPTDTAFLTDYGIDEARLATFASLDHDEMDHLLLENMTSAREWTSDVCVFFLNETGGMRAVAIGSRNALGETRGPTGSYAPCQWDRACAHYPKSTIHVKPVLRYGQVVNMYVAVCSE